MIDENEITMIKRPDENDKDTFKRNLKLFKESCNKEPPDFTEEAKKVGEILKNLRKQKYEKVQK